jgi:outer membrane protein
VVVSLVKEDYYTYQQDVGFVTVAASNLKRSQDQFSYTDAELKAGLGEPEDMVSAKTAVASAVIALTTAQATAESARSLLAQEMGIDPRTPFAPQNAEEPAPPSASESLTDLVDYALRHRPEIESAKEGVVSADYGVSSAKKNTLPKFSLSASLAPHWETDTVDSDTVAVGVVVTWDIFDSGYTQGLVQQANGVLDAAKGTLIQETNQVVQDVSQANLDLQSATARITSAAQEVGNAEEYVRISTGRYRGGIGTFLDVITANAALTSAQRDQVQAQFDLQKARVEIKRAIGANP